MNSYLHGHFLVFSISLILSSAISNLFNLFRMFESSIIFYFSKFHLLLFHICLVIPCFLLFYFFSISYLTLLIFWQFWYVHLRTVYIDLHLCKWLGLPLCLLSFVFSLLYFKLSSKRPNWWDFSLKVTWVCFHEEPEGATSLLD